MTNTKLPRLTALAALFGAVTYATGDILMHGVPAELADFPSLVPFGDKVADLVRMLVVSETRMFVGTIGLMFLAPLGLAQGAHLFLALKGSGRITSWAPAALLLWVYALSPLVHGSFFFIGKALRLLAETESAQQQPIFDLYYSFAKALFFLYIPVILAAAVAWIWASIAIGRGRSLYPRWMAVLNPLLGVFVFQGLGRLVPGALGEAIVAASTNLGSIVFFATATWWFWRREEPVG